MTEIIIRQPKLNIGSIEEMSALGAREQGRDAASAFINEHEERGITISVQRNTIDALNRTIAEQANKIDLLQERVKNAEAAESEWLQYAVELSTQLRTNVAANVRALEVADRVAAALQAKIMPAKPVMLEKMEAELQQFLNGAKKPDEPLPLPIEQDGTTAATRMMLGPNPAMIV